MNARALLCFAIGFAVASAWDALRERLPMRRRRR
jgi:hypothetical protein